MASATADPLPWIHPSTAIVLGGLTLLSAVVYTILPRHKQSSAEKKKHILITGGSSGIGLAMAHECIKQECDRVTLVARNPKRLQEAVKSLHSPTVNSESCDVSNEKQLKLLASKLEQNPPTLLVCNAGLSSAAACMDTPLDEYERLWKVNVLGTVATIQAMLPLMRPGSSIIITSSMAGQVGIHGYTAYSATKYALRGFAESLSQELRPQGISVSLAFPPDTDTPGFKLENESKPLVTAKLSESGGLFQADAVAKGMLNAGLSENPPFCIWFGLDGWMLAMLTAGMSPVNTLVDAMCQVCLMGILRLVSLFYIWDWVNIVRKCTTEEKKAKSE